MSKQKVIDNRQTIKYGILSHNSDLFNINELFKIYFETIKPNIINNDSTEYSFNLKNYDNLIFCFNLIKEEEMKKLYELYNYFHFFLIFIDIQSIDCEKILELYINQLIDCSQDMTKKSYIFGIYKDEDKIINKDEKITNILNCKGIDYEYSEINIKKNDDFQKGMIFIIEDSKEIMEEIEFDELGNKYGKYQGRSCQVI